MKLNKLALIVALAAIACSAMAQGGGGGGGRRGGGQRGGGSPYAPMSLVRMAEVVTEVGITDDQKAKIAELNTSMAAKRQEAMQGATDAASRAEVGAKLNAEATKSLGEILKPEQMKRLRELQIQWSGKGLLATDKDLQKDLGIDDSQVAKIKDLQAREQAANREAGQGGDRQAAAEARTKNAKVLEDEIDKVLTDAQKAKLKDMGGKELAKPAPRRPGGGGGGV